MTWQPTLTEIKGIADYFPDGHQCRWLKLDEASGYMRPEGPVYLGMCTLKSIEAYDACCYECPQYERRGRA